jgi:hypothetical protein
MVGLHTSQQQSPDQVDSFIRSAMTLRRPVEGIYEGLLRLLCPYMLGRNKAGRLRVLCYQFGGASESGLQRKDGGGDWRCFSLEKIREFPWSPQMYRPNRNGNRPSTGA